MRRRRFIFGLWKIDFRVVLAFLLRILPDRQARDVVPTSRASRADAVTLYDPSAVSGNIPNDCVNC